MQHITANCSNVLKKFAPTNYKLEKFKDNNPKFAKGNDTNNSAAKGVQQQKPGRFDSHCVYCRGKDHVRNECPKLKKKEASKPPHTTGQPTAVAVVEAATDGAASSVACVQGNSKKMSFADPVVKVVKIGSTVCSKTALVDTGSPISFINASAFEEVSKADNVSLKCVDRNYKTIDGHFIDILGIWSTSIVFDQLPCLSALVDFHILKNDSVSADAIIGRDFLSNY
ncbi:unnamed protein product [Lasius platythorax]|uniref:Uncharacterized protein n=1 Tax=Lasius platythorax TaxID=488582 RepID=A0AAV2MYK2_9HYME